MRAHAGLLFAGIATYVLMGAAQATYGPALPAFARAHGLDLAGAGWIIPAHWIGCFLGVGLMFVAGGRITPRLTLVLMVAGAAIVAAGPVFAVVLAGAVIFGVGYGMATAVFNPRMLRAFGARGPAMLSLLNATFGIGAIAAPLIFVALGSDPGLAYAGIAALAVLVWLGAGPAGRESGGTQPAVTRQFRPHLPILAFGMIAIGTEATLIGLGPAALILSGLTEVEAARMLSAFFVAFVLARLVLVFAAHRIGPFQLFLVATFGAAVLAVLAAAAPAMAFVGLGACVGLFFPAYYVSASGLMGEDVRVPPTIVAAGLIGGISAPMMIAPWLETMGGPGFFWIVAAAMGAVALTGAVLRHRMTAASR
jgi:fucose permease